MCLPMCDPSIYPGGKDELGYRAIVSPSSPEMGVDVTCSIRVCINIHWGRCLRFRIEGYGEDRASPWRNPQRGMTTHNQDKTQHYSETVTEVIRAVSQNQRGV